MSHLHRQRAAQLALEAAADNKTQADELAAQADAEDKAAIADDAKARGDAATAQQTDEAAK